MKLFQNKVIIISLFSALIVSGLTIFLLFGQIPLLFYHHGEQYSNDIPISIIVHLNDCDFGYNYMYLYAPHLADHDEGGSRHLYNGAKLKYGESAELYVHLDHTFTQRSHATWRTLYRDDESILMVYINITETPFSLLRREYYHLFTGGIRTQSRPAPTTAFQNIDSFPQNIEIY